MGFYTSQITCVGDYPQQSGRWLVVQTDHRDKLLQCYVSGELVDVQAAPLGKCEFFIPHIEQTDLVLFLAVDSEDAQENYWEEAFAQSDQLANRIKVQLSACPLKYDLKDKWRVYLSCPGKPFDSPAYQQDIFTEGKGACGYGLGYWSGYGFDVSGAPGYGTVYDGEYGLEYEKLVWVTDTLGPGDYDVSVVVVDSVDNESPAYEQTVSISGYAACAADLKVQQYDPQTNELTLSFTPSGDL